MKTTTRTLRTQLMSPVLESESPQGIEPSLPPEVVLHEPAETYHAKANEYLTSHALADFRKCLLLYHRQKLGLIEDEDRPAYLVGRALHTLVLEKQERFDAEYAVGGPINPRTGERFGSNTTPGRNGPWLAASRS
jgi:hypothetical protein